MNTNIFISYRRSGGDIFAHILFQELTNLGYSVFQDVETLRSGRFDDVIHKTIEQCTDFILILSPHSLDGCFDSSDWIRREVQWALNAQKNIIPVLLQGFSWSETLPDFLLTIKSSYNSIKFDTEHYDWFFGKLVTFLHSSPTQSSQGEETLSPQKHRAIFEGTYIVQTIMVAGVIFGILMFPLIIIFWYHIEFGLFPRIIYYLLLIGVVQFFFYELDTRPSVAAYCYGTLTENSLNEHPDIIYGKLCSAFGKKCFRSVTQNQIFSVYYYFKRLEFGTWDNKRINYLKLTFSQHLEWYFPSCLYLHARTTEAKAIRMLTRQGFLLRPQHKSPISDLDYFAKGDLHVFLSSGKHLNYLLFFHCPKEELSMRIQQVGGNTHA